MPCKHATSLIRVNTPCLNILGENLSPPAVTRFFLYCKYVRFIQIFPSLTHFLGIISSGCFARLLFLCSSQTTQRNPTMQHQGDFFFQTKCFQKRNTAETRSTNPGSTPLSVIIADFMYRLLSFYYCAVATVTLLISSLSFCVYPTSFFISG